MCIENHTHRVCTAHWKSRPSEPAFLVEIGEGTRAASTGAGLQWKRRLSPICCQLWSPWCRGTKACVAESQWWARFQSLQLGGTSVSIIHVCFTWCRKIFGTDHVNDAIWDGGSTARRYLQGWDTSIISQTAPAPRAPLNTHPQPFIQKTRQLKSCIRKSVDLFWPSQYLWQQTSLHKQRSRWWWWQWYLWQWWWWRRRRRQWRRRRRWRWWRCMTKQHYMAETGRGWSS